MKAEMSKQSLHAWQKRWKNVHRAEVDELRRTHRVLKYKQFVALMSDADFFGKITSDVNELASIRARWRILREKSLHG